MIVASTDKRVVIMSHYKERMSTKTEPYRKYVAHDEKSKFFIFLPVIHIPPYEKPRNVVGLLILK